jgi:prepilin-type N-terminal cleavage/methylation domain-containing protein
VNRRGFSLVEAVVSLVVVSVMLVAALAATGAARATQLRGDHRQRGAMLGQSLMIEIQSLPYKDPNEVSLLGIELSEVLGSRSSFDDVDDFNGYSESPIEERDGTPVDGFSGWSRAVAVAYVSGSDFDTVSLTDQGFKRITVTVSRGGSVVARLVGLRGEAGDGL